MKGNSHHRKLASINQTAPMHTQITSKIATNIRIRVNLGNDFLGWAGCLGELVINGSGTGSE
jgi:hypothetical protein